MKTYHLIIEIHCALNVCFYPGNNVSASHLHHKPHVLLIVCSSSWSLEVKSGHSPSPNMISLLCVFWLCSDNWAGMFGKREPSKCLFVIVVFPSKATLCQIWHIPTPVGSSWEKSCGLPAAGRQLAELWAFWVPGNSAEAERAKVGDLC